MKLGCEILLTEGKGLLKGMRVGVLAHAGSIDSKGKHLVDRLVNEGADGGWKVTALFAPEHGLYGKAQDMETVKSAKFKVRSTELPIHSLYGDTFASLSPTPEMIKDIDVMVIDLQDIGSRYYTYAATMALAMRMCLAKGVKVVVCDRPNPINGVDTEGPVIEPEFRSFVGMFPLRVRHGLTIGEIAQYEFDNEPKAEKYAKEGLFNVVKMEGWQREWYLDQTGLKWTNPSPNMRSLSAALLYPGMCLLEGTNISEGRGTHTPFETIGAPWMDGEELVKKMRSLKLKGVDFDSTVFTPTSRKFEGERCEGLQFVITDRSSFRPYLTGLALIHVVSTLYPRHFKWRKEPYEFVDDIPAIDLLTGNAQFRKLIDKKKPFEDIAKLA